MSYCKPHFQRMNVRIAASHCVNDEFMCDACFNGKPIGNEPPDEEEVLSEKERLRKARRAESYRRYYLKKRAAILAKKREVYAASGSLQKQNEIA